ncbi:hypothetical protein CCAN12_720007 [Capnocytophaga canimorsus]|uniref:Uncharacterized protein n=1 Tax=Capnocytophaga canimorsus TaxID=28188 RepID=A0A0B7HH04_9FLAO|nr:hypothetical protein [Capnocytophaga canimorsus]CEN37944.1 hypothetical protein CCAN12_720007 [Capnocytophaga canimorsus]
MNLVLPYVCITDKNLADDEATLASIRRSDAKGGDVKINGKMLVGNFEKKILEEFGIKVQVATPDDSKTFRRFNHINSFWKVIFSMRIASYSNPYSLKIIIKWDFLVHSKGN